MSVSPIAGSRDWVRPEPTRREYRSDLLLAGILLVLMAGSVVLSSSAGMYEKPAPLWVGALCVAATCVPLAARRRIPEVVLVIVAIVFAATQILQVPESLVSNIALFIAMYSVGAWRRSPTRAIVVRAVVILGMFVWIFVELVARASDPSILSRLPATGAVSPIVAVGLLQLITNLLYFGGAYYFGDRAFAAAHARAVLEQRTIELADERELNSRRAVTLERLRIARDLHDVVAHHVSVMGVQAGAARRVIASDAQQATASLVAIEASARNAVTELHRMLTTLRDDELPDDPGGSTVNGLAQLGDLVDEVRSTGMDVRFQAIGEPRDAAATVGITVYRVAQEAITNTLKHAGPAAALDVRLRYLDDGIEIELTDSGGRSAAAVSPSGLGQRGMRERVSAVGGRIELGPRPSGGYLVRATIPTGPEHAEESP